MAKKTHYAIVAGHASMTIVTTWSACKELVDGFSGAKFKGFSCEHDAKCYLAQNNNYKPKPKKVRACRPVETDDDVIPDESPNGTFIPPLSQKTDRFGYFKPIYYRENGCLLADYGRTIGAFYVQSDDTTTPW